MFKYNIKNIVCNPIIAEFIKFIKVCMKMLVMQLFGVLVGKGRERKYGKEGKEGKESKEGREGKEDFNNKWKE